jgi:hypothetical protein
MPDLLWDTAISASRSVAETASAALIRHSGTPEVQQYYDARRSLDVDSIDDALDGLAAVDAPLATALSARRRLAAQCREVIE